MTDEKKKGRLYKNVEGYSDPTAGCAMESVSEAERQRLEVMSAVIHIMKATADLAGFKVIERIILEDKKTGKKYK